jgi:gluconate 2-dehydrogenase gamma chain
LHLHELCTGSYTGITIFPAGFLFCDSSMTDLTRRELVVGTALALIAESAARGSVISGRLPWRPTADAAPETALPSSWQYFNTAEVAAMEALVDRIIPPDPETPGGKDAGCAVFIDRQLAGPYGREEGLYNQPPFTKGTKEQGPQSPDGPAATYRKALAALDQFTKTKHDRTFAQLPPEEQDAMLHGLESGAVELAGLDGKAFLVAFVKDVQMGFFADPIYGGNRDMCAWKMIGFPGAHYDYRDWVTRHNQRYPHPPVSISGRPEWTPK